jgi:hypothetical protein
VERLEHRIERLGVGLRFTWAFHAREVRFERSTGDSFERVFPETFSFHAERHDPAELYLQLDDLWTNPRRIAQEANRRDAERTVRRLAFALPRYLERTLDRLEAEGRLEGEALAHVHGDLVVLALVFSRFLADKGLAQEEDLRIPAFHLRKLTLRALDALVRRRVSPECVARFVASDEEGLESGEELSETGLFYALAGSDRATAERWLLGMAERAWYQWLEDVCLDESNQAFEVQDSPFADRETEVLRAVSLDGQRRLARGRDLVPFLRRSGNRDCLRALRGLEGWFLRQYDVYHAAVMIQHRGHLERGVEDGGRVLSRHTPRNYLGLLLLLASPFLAAIFAYGRAPRVFDALTSLEVAFILGNVFWFLLYRFCWKRDLTFFHASVPRIGAGIIVGYLPVFLIDEVWDLMSGPPFTLLLAVALLGFANLLYLYVEVARRLPDSRVAFARAGSIFLLGVLEAFVLGIVMTSLFGGFMAERNWADPLGVEGAHAGIEAIRAATPAFAGELPRIMGFEPLLAFPSAVLLMTFLSFFIGTFLQLMWEDIPLTEPL